MIQLFFLPHCTFVIEITDKNIEEREKFGIGFAFFPLFFRETKTKVDHQMDVSKRIKTRKRGNKTTRTEYKLRGQQDLIYVMF